LLDHFDEILTNLF